MVTKPYQDYPTTPPRIIMDQPLVESPQNLYSARKLASSMDILQDQMNRIARQRDELTALTNGSPTPVHHRKDSVRSSCTVDGAPNLNPPGHLVPVWSPRDEEPTALLKGDSTNVHRCRDSMRSTSTVDGVPDSRNPALPPRDEEPAALAIKMSTYGHRRRDSLRSSSTVDGAFDSYTQYNRRPDSARSTSTVDGALDPWNTPDPHWQTLSTQGSEEELEPNDPRLRVWPDPNRPWLIPSPSRVHLNPRYRFGQPPNRVGTSHPALAEALGALDIATDARRIDQYHHQAVDSNTARRNSRPTYVISAPNATHINITSRVDRRDSPEPARQRHRGSSPDWNHPSSYWGDSRPRPHYGAHDEWDYPGPRS